MPENESIFSTIVLTSSGASSLFHGTDCMIYPVFELCTREEERPEMTSSVVVVDRLSIVMLA
jgi:hypothetical protein